MSHIEDLFTITCGKCGKTEVVEQWVHDKHGFEWIHGKFVCPWCGYGFRRKRKLRRKPWEPLVVLVEEGK